MIMCQMEEALIHLPLMIGEIGIFSKNLVVEDHHQPPIKKNYTSQRRAVLAHHLQM